MFEVDLALQYSDGERAGKSAAEVRRLVDQARVFLSVAESATEVPLNSPAKSIDESLGGLATLALIRQGREYLDAIVVNEMGETVRLTAQIDNEIPTAVLICLNAIQAIGTSANEEFEAITDQLEAP